MCCKGIFHFTKEQTNVECFSSGEESDDEGDENLQENLESLELAKENSKFKKENRELKRKIYSFWNKAKRIGWKWDLKIKC